MEQDKIDKKSDEQIKKKHGQKIGHLIKKKKNLNNELSFLFCLIIFSLKSKTRYQ